MRGAKLNLPREMMPFVHIGPLTFGMYGIMLATGFFVGFYILRGELQRREILQARPAEIVCVLMLGALVFSKLYWLLQHPGFLLHRGHSVGRTGLTYYGGLLGDVLLVLWLARRYHMSAWVLCDVLSAACALGFGIGRIGCFFAGDGDYGVPTSLPWGMSFPHGLVPTLQRVHPAPLYEFATSAAIAAYLWHLGSPKRRPSAPPGMVFAQFLIWTGIARFLVEFIKRNPPVWLGLVNAQWVGTVSAAVGLALLLRLYLLRARSLPTGSASVGPLIASPPGI